MPRSAARPWRAFGRRETVQIKAQMQQAGAPCCPCCGDLLEACPGSRLARRLPLGSVAYDLVCRACRRFHAVVCRTSRTVRLHRMRRFATAVALAGSRRLDAALRPRAAPV